MSKPFIHALNSSKRFGGKPEDYLEIHNFMDSSKSAFADNRCRALTHNSWFINTVLERVFGVTLTNSEGKIIPVKDIAENHVLDDFGHKFIPTAQDYLQEIEYCEWMNGNGFPPSRTKIESKKIKRIINLNE